MRQTACWIWAFSMLFLKSSNSACRDRQTVLFSATFPDGVLELARRFQQPEVARVSTMEEHTLAAPTTIGQFIVETTAEGKLEALCGLLKGPASGSALIFCNFKISAEK